MLWKFYGKIKKNEPFERAPCIKHFFTPSLRTNRELISHAKIKDVPVDLSAGK